MDWRQRLAAYNKAKAERDRAWALFDDAYALYLTAARHPTRPLAPMTLGVELARQRALRTTRRFKVAEFQLTQGRNLDEVIWSLPDDI